MFDSLVSWWNVSLIAWEDFLSLFLGWILAPIFTGSLDDDF